MIDVSIIIVNYKTPDLTDICVGSIVKFTEGIHYEIIVLDNDSQDHSEALITQKYPQVKWINVGYNSGTSIPYNMGLRKAKGQYAIIQNSDTEYTENVVLKSYNKYRELEQTMKMGLMGCQIVGYDKIIQFNANWKFYSIKNYLRANPFFIYMNWLQEKPTFEQLTELHKRDGACAWLGIPFGIFNMNIVRKEEIWFDEDIFMYYDDEEWCYRLAKSGYKNYITVCTHVLHWNGGSSFTTFSNWRHGQINLSRWLFFIKKHGKLYFTVCILLLLFNQLLDSLFYAKSKLRNNVSEEEERARQLRKFDRELLSTYFFKLLLTYKKQTSGSGKFAKFELKQSK